MLQPRTLYTAFFFTAFSLFAFHLSHLPDWHFKYIGCSQRRATVSGYGSISLYIHITHIALAIMSTDRVDQQNIVVEPRRVLLKLAVTMFSEAAYSIQMPGLIDQKPWWRYTSQSRSWPQSKTLSVSNKLRALQSEGIIISYLCYMISDKHCLSCLFTFCCELDQNIYI